MRDANIPETTITEELLASGLLRTDHGELPDVTLRLALRPYLPAPEDQRCVVDAGPHRNNELISFLRQSPVHPTFVGTAPGGADVEVEFWDERTERGRVTGGLLRLDINVAPTEGVPEEQLISVRLTPTDLLQPAIPVLVSWWTGERKPMNEEGLAEPEEWIVATELGEWSLSRAYRWEDVRVGETTGHMSVPCPIARLRLADDACIRNVGDLVSAVLEQLAPACDAISFLGRRLVRPWEVKVISSGEAENGKWWLESRTVLRPISTPNPVPKARWPLVWGARLPSDGLAQVIAALRRSPYRDSILPATHSLIAYWRGEYIETSTAITFAALETLVNGISRTDDVLLTLNKRDFKVVERRVKGAIRTAGKELGLSKATRSRLYEKITELRRASLVPRVCDCVERWGVSWRDLFGPDASLEDELRAAYRRRSRLVHEGHMDDPGALVEDAARIHALTERLVYSMLEAPSDWSQPRSHEYAFWRPSGG